MEELKQNNSFRPTEPDQLELSRLADTYGTGATIHSLKNIISAISLRWELGESNGWTKEDRDFYDEAVNNFYQKIKRGY